MNFKSHIKLAGYLHPFLSVRKIAFIFGSVEPDIAVFTYLKGTLHGKKLHGHDCHNMRIRIAAITKKIMEDGFLGIRQSYRLGKLTHYIADSFTFPHNDAFRGTINEHMEYEDELEMVLDGSFICDSISVRASDVPAFIERMHDEYVKAEPSAETDASYIVSVTYAAVYAFAGRSLSISAMPSVEMP